jgi:ACS family glucarate transporter-like MFS transporter
VNQPNQAKVGSLVTGKRFNIVIFLFFNAVINYIDRINLSVAAPAIAKEFNWDPGTMGIIFSAFLWTYAVCLIPCGWLADKIGTRKVNAISISIWSAAAMLTGAVVNFGTMLAARLALGVGEAASYPAAGKIIRQWIPANERGLATAIFNSGAYAGPAIATPIVAWIVLETGWRASFFILGFLGFIWLYFWLKMFRAPEECKWLSSEEREYILSHNNTETPGPANEESAQTTGIVAKLLRKKTMWGLALTQGCGVYTQYLFLSWLPTYLVQAKNMQLMKASIFSALPYLIAVILGIVVGKLSDHILTPDKIQQGKRRSMVIVFMMLSSIVLLTTTVNNEYVVLLLISLSLTCISSAITLNIALTNDLVSDPRIAGTAFGILILGGNIFGLTAPVLTGYIVKATGSFDSAFFLAGGLLLLGAVLSFSLTRSPINVSTENS